MKNFNKLLHVCILSVISLACNAQFQVNCELAKRDFKAYLDKHIFILDKKENLLLYGKCFLENEKNVLEGYGVTDKMKIKDPGLIYLILNTSSMASKNEKQEWFTLYGVMNDDQIEKLYNILIKEYVKLREIDIKYGDKLADKNDNSNLLKNQVANSSLELDNFLIFGCPQERKSYVSIWQYSIKFKKFTDIYNNTDIIDSTNLIYLSPNDNALIELYSIDKIRFDAILEKYENILYTYTDINYWKIYEKIDSQYTLEYYLALLLKYDKKHEKSREIRDLISLNIESLFEDPKQKKKIVETKLWQKYLICYDLGLYVEAFDTKTELIKKGYSRLNNFNAFSFYLLSTPIYEQSIGTKDPYFEKLLISAFDSVKDTLIKKTDFDSILETHFMLIDFAKNFSSSMKVQSIAQKICNDLDTLCILSNINNYKNKWYYYLTTQYKNGGFHTVMDFEKIQKTVKDTATRLGIENTSQDLEAAVVEYATYYLLYNFSYNKSANINKLKEIARSTKLLCVEQSSIAYSYVEKHILNILLNIDNSNQKELVNYIPLNLQQAKYYALVIGINEYNSPDFPVLKNAVNDARAMADILSSNYYFKIDSLFNLNATRSNIMKSINDIKSKVDSNTSVLIFYAGHGFYDKETDLGYIVCCDVQNKSNFWEMIGYKEIQSLVLPISKKAKHTLVISDACFSGALTRGGCVNLIEKEDKSNSALSKSYELKSATAMTSGNIETVKDFGNSNNNSIFTEYLIKALKDNNDAVFDAMDLFLKVQVFSNQVEQTPLFKPIPGTVDEGGQFIFRRK